MGRLVVNCNVTLDGVVQGPASPDEDVRDGFSRGGWAAPLATDPVVGRIMGERMSRNAGGGLLLGRRTYEQFFRVWPQRKNNPYTEVLNRTQKYVVSTTLAEPLPWENSTLVSGDVPRAVARLKEEQQGTLVILGSGQLVRSLLPHRLIDEFVLIIVPVVLGSGHRLFPDSGALAPFRLVECSAGSSGAIVAVYQPAPSA